MGRRPDGRVVKAEEVRRADTVSAYEVSLATGGRAVKTWYDPSGRFIRETVK